MQRRVIAFDFDDVLMHFNAEFAAFHNRIHGTDIVYEDIKSYDMTVSYKQDAAVLIEQLWAFYRSSDHANARPIPGAIEAIQRLRDRHRLEVVTSRPEEVREHTDAWIQKHFPDLFRQLHFANGVSGTAGHKKRPKSDICKEIDAAVLIEDALAHAEDVAAHGIPVLLPDRPWNRDYTPRGVERVETWDDIVSWIENHL